MGIKQVAESTNIPPPHGQNEEMGINEVKLQFSDIYLTKLKLINTPG